MKPMQNEWAFFFDRHAPRYMDNTFTKNTLEEVEFILEELALPAESHILDVGCGTGRHSIELARRGYKMTGVDISKGMLREARRNADSMGVKIDLIHADAIEFKAEKEFDAAICICEGAFGLLGSEDDPYQHDLNILRNINQALKSDGMLVLTALNGMLKIRGATQEAITNGTFNPLTLTEIFPLEYEDQGGPKKITVRERGFVPSELVLMLHVAGFRVERIWGGTAGNWKRKEVDLDEMEIMVIARKELNGA
ncbi:MAG: cyclopropane-fatty-acyl-phospholipid synthase [Anaerolineae bacterium SM23_ 63]|nr:MAG: cyclopropane-fatty-acyl-phospholipid synthase [Anaerolineae bacterium SM23_ 63]